MLLFSTLIYTFFFYHGYIYTTARHNSNNNNTPPARADPIVFILRACALDCPTSIRQMLSTRVPPGHEPPSCRRKTHIIIIIIMIIAQYITQCYCHTYKHEYACVCVFGLPSVGHHLTYLLTGYLCHGFNVCLCLFNDAPWPTRFRKKKCILQCDVIRLVHIVLIRCVRTRRYVQTHCSIEILNHPKSTTLNTLGPVSPALGTTDSRVCVCVYNA